MTVSTGPASTAQGTAKRKRSSGAIWHPCSASADRSERPRTEPCARDERRSPVSRVAVPHEETGRRLENLDRRHHSEAVVERAYAWLYQVKRLRARYHVRADLHLGLLIPVALIYFPRPEHAIVKPAVSRSAFRY